MKYNKLVSFGLLAMLVFSGLAGFIAIAPENASATTDNFTPTADSYVNPDSPTTNYGTSTTLSSTSGANYTYLRWNLTAAGLPSGALITAVTLYIYRTDSGGSDTTTLANYDYTDWSETAITYNNMPAYKDWYDGFSCSAGSGWKSYTGSGSNFPTESVMTVVREAFNATGKAYLRVQASTGTEIWSSKEGANAPYLAITYTYTPPPVGYVPSIDWLNTWGTVSNNTGTVEVNITRAYEDRNFDHYVVYNESLDLTNSTVTSDATFITYDIVEITVADDCLEFYNANWPDSDDVVAGTYWVNLTAADAVDGTHYSYYNFTFTVYEDFSIDSSAVTTAMVGVPYSYTATATQSATWAIDSFSPSGLGTLNLTPTADTYLSTSAGGPAGRGQSTSLMCEPGGSGTYVWIYMRWNLTGIPAGATIDWTSAKLWMYAYSDTSYKINIYPLNGDNAWSENVGTPYIPEDVPTHSNDVGVFWDNGTTSGWMLYSDRTVESGYNLSYIIQSQSTLSSNRLGLMILSNAGGSEYYSKEGTYVPHLNITYTNAPSWLSIGSSNGTLYGTPSMTGSYDVSLLAVNSDGLIDYQNFTITVGTPWAPTFTSSPTTTVKVGAAYSYTVTCNETVTWTTSSTNATWLTFTGANATWWGRAPMYLASYYVRTEATSTAGLLSAWQNFTLSLTGWSPEFLYYTNYGGGGVETHIEYTKYDVMFVFNETCTITLFSNASFLATEIHTNHVYIYNALYPAGTDVTPYGWYYVNIRTVSTAGLLTSWYNYTLTIIIVDIIDPVASFTRNATATYVGWIVYFDGTGSTDNTGVTNWTWSLGGVARWGSTVSYAFTSSGVKTCTLTVYDAEGNFDSTSLTVTVKVIPVANAGVDRTAGVGISLQFLGSGTTGVTNYTWNFTFKAVPYTLWGANPVFTFDNTTGSPITVTLTVSDGTLTDTDTMTVTIVFPADIPPTGGDTVNYIFEHIVGFLGVAALLVCILIFPVTIVMVRHGEDGVKAGVRAVVVFLICAFLFLATVVF